MTGGVSTCLWDIAALLHFFKFPCCDTVAEPSVNTGLYFLFANIAVSKSRHRLFFYPTKERVKRTEKDLFSIFLSKGGRL